MNHDEIEDCLKYLMDLTNSMVEELQKSDFPPSGRWQQILLKTKAINAFPTSLHL